MAKNEYLVKEVAALLDAFNSVFTADPSLALQITAEVLSASAQAIKDKSAEAHATPNKWPVLLETEKGWVNIDKFFEANYTLHEIKEKQDADIKDKSLMDARLNQVDPIENQMIVNQINELTGSSLEVLGSLVLGKIKGEYRFKVAFNTAVLLDKLNKAGGKAIIGFTNSEFEKRVMQMLSNFNLIEAMIYDN